MTLQQAGLSRCVQHPDCWVAPDGICPSCAEELLTSGEVAEIFRVNAKTVSRWASNGKLPFFRTLGGHRRFRRGDVWALIRSETMSR